MGDLLAKNIFVFFAVLLKILYMSERRHKLSTLVSPFQSSALALPAEALPPKQLASPPPEPDTPGSQPSPPRPQAPLYGARRVTQVRVRR